MARRKTFHDSTTGKFVSKERVKNDPEGTVVVTSCNLHQELVDFCLDLGLFSKEKAEREVDRYLDRRE